MAAYSSLFGSLAVYLPGLMFSLLVARKIGGDSAVFLRTAALAEFAARYAELPFAAGWRRGHGQAVGAFSQWQMLLWSQLAAVSFSAACVATAFGLVVFTDVPPGPALVRLHDVGFERTIDVGSGAQSLDLRVAPRGRISLKVLDANRTAVPDATVWVCAKRGKKSPGYPAAITDANGRAEVSVFLPVFFVWARVPGGTVTLMKGPLAGKAGQQVTLRSPSPEEATKPASMARAQATL